MDIQDVSFFKGLSVEELVAVKSCLQEKSFAKGESLFMEGDSCERIFFVKSGRVKLCRTAPGGREQILQTLEAGDTCACHPGTSGWHCSSSAEAVVPSTVWFLSRENYFNLIRTEPRLTSSLTRLLAERLQCFSALIEEVSLKDSKKRLVKFLLDLAEKGDGETLAISFTREELAQRIGMARETVTRQLHDLQRRGLIDLLPQRISILDAEGLKKLL